MENIIDFFPKYFLHTVKSRVQGFIFSFFDVVEADLGLRDDLTPPRQVIFGIGGRYKEIGEEFLRYFINIGELKPH